MAVLHSLHAADQLPGIGALLGQRAAARCLRREATAEARPFDWNEHSSAGAVRRRLHVRPHHEREELPLRLA